jgi:uroporphyrinogen-III synthase
MEQLSEAGIPAIHSPAFEIEQASESQLGDRIDGLKAFDAVVVTSPVAARLIAGRAASAGNRPLCFFAPGAGTAAVLHSAGLQCKFPDGGGTSEHILAMPDFVEVDASRIAIVGAPGGRGLIASELSRRGAVVEAVYVYRRKLLSPAPELISALRQGHDPVVLISSRQAFDMLTDSLDEELRPAWLNARFVVSSERLKRLCSGAGVSRIRQAPGAADEHMLATALDAGWMRG